MSNVHALWKILPNVSYVWSREPFQEWNHVPKFIVLLIFQPSLWGHGVLRLVIIRIRRIIHDDNIFNLSAQSWHVFDHITRLSIYRAMLSEEHCRAISIKIYLVEDRLSILLNRRCEHYNFVELAHLLDKLFRIRPYVHINSLQVTIQIYWLLDVCIPNFFETRMDKRLVQIKDQSFHSLMMFLLRAQKCWLVLFWRWSPIWGLADSRQLRLLVIAIYYIIFASPTILALSIGIWNSIKATVVAPRTLLYSEQTFWGLLVCCHQRPMSQEIRWIFVQIHKVDCLLICVFLHWSFPSFRRLLANCVLLRAPILWVSGPIIQNVGVSCRWVDVTRDSPRSVF